MQQIKDKKYTESLSDYTGNILMVGLNYDSSGKNMSAFIEKYSKNKIVKN